MGVLVLLPCNRGVYYGDYMLGQNWRMVYRALKDLIEEGSVELAAIDICKPGVVVRGEERGLAGCDELPWWSPEKEARELPILVPAIKEDLRTLSRKYGVFVAYINVKIYRKALLEAVRELREAGWGAEFHDVFPGRYSPLAFRARKNIARLREVVERAVNGLPRNA